MSPLQKIVQQWGRVFYQVTLVYQPEDMEAVRRLTKDGQIVPDTITLLWDRNVGQPWERSVTGSFVTGNEKIGGVSGAVGPRRNKQVYTQQLRDIRRWVDVYPGLRSAIDEAERGLPE